jgi:hypothetical protein
VLKLQVGRLLLLVQVSRLFVLLVFLPSRGLLLLMLLSTQPGGLILLLLLLLLS